MFKRIQPDPVPNLSLSFLSKPTHLVLKDDWQVHYLKYFKASEVVDVDGSFKKLIRHSKKSLNVLRVFYLNNCEFIGDYKTNIALPPICFKKNMSTATLLTGE